MANNPKCPVPVSVVVPCYRCSQTIERAVESVVKQRALPFEIILVDDYSGDDTLSLLQALKIKYPSLILIVEMSKNSGAASARNAGWAVASQPYIAFLDSDDSWHPDKLKIQYEIMKSNNNGIALCGHQCPQLLDTNNQSQPPKDPSLTNITASSLLFKNAFSTPTVMLRRDIPFRFQEGKRYAEDLLLWQQIALSGLYVVRIESPLAWVHKSLYGETGLSANLWGMEKGELENIYYLYCNSMIGFFSFIISFLFSMIKFARRIMIVKFREVLRCVWH